MTETVLDTKRLRLNLQSPQEVLRWIESLEPHVKAEISPEYLKRLLAASDPDPWTCMFSMVDRLTDKLIGTCGFKGPPDLDGIVEIAYGVEIGYQGRGYATEAAQALTDFSWNNARVSRVRAHSKSNNIASERVLQKIGFTFIGEIDDPEDGLVNRWEKTQERKR